jgi:succinate dehydrogenase flavin-adding protein (antitoxin of CptAB toxin-antitoxin module)
MSDSITAYHDREKDRQDSYVQSVKEKFEQRSQTGIKKYNTTLEREDLDFLDWLNHLQEELMDATLYIEKLKDFAQKNP